MIIKSNYNNKIHNRIKLSWKKTTNKVYKLITNQINRHGLNGLIVF